MSTSEELHETIPAFAVSEGKITEVFFVDVVGSEDGQRWRVVPGQTLEMLGPVDELVLEAPIGCFSVLLAGLGVRLGDRLIYSFSEGGAGVLSRCETSGREWAAVDEDAGVRSVGH